MTKVLLAVIALSLVVIAGSYAKSTFASIPDSTGVIHGCYANGTYGTTPGDLRVIDTAPRFPAGSQSCKPGETPITWNQTGAAGAPGMNGTNGTNGAPGISGYEIVSKQITDTENIGGEANTIGFEVACPAGKVALGGGGSAFVNDEDSVLGPADLAESFPSSSGGINKWEVHFGKGDGSTFNAGEGLFGNIYVTCAIVTP